MIQTSIKLGDDVWIEPAGFLGSIDGFENTGDGIVYHVFVPSSSEEDDE